MLIDLLNKVISQVNALDSDKDAKAMWGEIGRNRPDIADQVESADEKVRALLAGAIAGGALQLVKRLPEMIHKLVEPLQTNSHNARVRCALAGTLAYIVQPHDLVPDNSPGGYGFLDDFILARTALIEFLSDIEGLEPATPESLKISARMLPAGVVPAMQQAVDGVSMTYQLLGNLPDSVLEFVTAQIVQNPLAAAGATSALHGGPQLGGQAGFFGSSGAYIEGNNITIPGGPSLIDGNLFIPD